MSEQFYIYSLNIILFLGAYEGFKQGATYQVLSIIFLILSNIFCIIIYDESLIRKFLAIIIFFFIHIIGLFICFLMKQNTKKEKLIGMIFGIVKFFLYLINLTTIANLINSMPMSYKENFYVKLTNNISENLTQKIKQYIKNKKSGKKEIRTLDTKFA